MHTHSTIRHFFLISLALPLLLSGCETPSWLGGGAKEIKRAPGERLDIVLTPSSIKPDPSVADQPVEIPDQANLSNWISRNDAMLTPHIGLTGVDQHASVTIGNSTRFTRDELPSPIIINEMVIAMNAEGTIGAYDTKDLHQLWVLDLAGKEAFDDVLGGGLAVGDNIVYATLGFGKLGAIDLKTGKLLWTAHAGAPVRGAPAIDVANKRVIVLTADNQTLGFDAATGEPRWEHRGIREAAGYYSTTAPVVSDGIVITCYSSGEVFALRSETGNVLWSDTLASADKTNASAVFNGIDADPIVQDGVVVVTSASGQMQASALLNGRPLWQQKIGTHTTPWSAGNAVFALSTTHDLVAIFKRNGAVRWSQSLAKLDERNKDITPLLYGPIVAGNAVLVITGDGEMRTFNVREGKPMGVYPLADGVGSAPVIADGALYLVSKNGKLHKFY